MSVHERVTTMTRLSRLCAGVMGAIVIAGVFWSTDASGRDWNVSPAIIQMDTRQSVYVLGDIHQQYTNLVAVLKTAGIVAPEFSEEADPTTVQWIARKSVLVQLGDLIAKGPKGVEVVRFFRALETSAERKGGRVIVVMGNNDARFLANPASASDFAAQLAAAGLDPAAVADGTDPEGMGAWLRSLPFAARVNGWFLVHAGNTKGDTIEGLRTKIQEAVDTIGFGAPFLTEDLQTDPHVYGGSILETPLPDPEKLKNNKPVPEIFPNWWDPAFYVPYADTTPPLPVDPRSLMTAPQILRTYASALEVEHIVQAHQWQKIFFWDGDTRPRGSIFQKLGLIFFTDAGMTSSYDPAMYNAYYHLDPPETRQLKILLIERGLTEVTGTVIAEVDGRADEPIWSEFLGDLDLDWLITPYDLFVLMSSYRTKLGDAGFNRRADLVIDNEINVLDVLQWLRLYFMARPPIWRPPLCH
jgi:hypothetical protein